ncbi:alpha-L-fucosidase [Lachnoclostridium sp. Marseille-P6806]|uniref:alpha-L-fucosidase n=1 Tax=Lachnoclostridium sp. Marseille-P6806 TaxID=2364793 RepID=UPI00103242C4|nr:alpha-L-fucosidase [Lachnoclostridium sp. Marseille-P6806]
MTFEPTYESVCMHPLPDWYDDAKFGIFIHWSLFSVPGYAPVDGRDVIRLQKQTDMHYMMQHNPYAEWYLNTLRIAGSPTREFHEKNYGSGFSYFEFQKEFEQYSRKVNFDSWAQLMKDSGARYAVLVTKHHDGYCLWPSMNKNPMEEGFQSPVDLVGDWVEAVRAKGIRAGLYYSGMYDWTFNDIPIENPYSKMKHQLASPMYANYATAQWRELIERYRPSVLWNDMGYPAGIDLNRLMADYYNSVPDGVVNERWDQAEIPWNSSAEAVRSYAQRMCTGSGNEIRHVNFHFDFSNPEYTDTNEIQTKKFEFTRGIGLSFGYNREETAREMLTPSQLVYILTDTVSKNGNVLLNIGPMVDGSISEIQKKPLMALGRWLKTNGEAIYGTRPWIRAEAKTDDGTAVRFTRKGEQLFIIVLSEKPMKNIRIRNLTLRQGARMKLLGFEGGVFYRNQESDLHIQLEKYPKKQLAYAFQLS